MGRPPNYGRVGSRRGSSAVWQWMIIGITLGFACSAVVVLALLTVGILNLDGAGLEVASNITPTLAPTQNVQATVDLAVRQTFEALPTNTPPPTEEPASPAVLQPPTPTPTTDPALLEPTETAAPTATTAASNPPAQTGGNTTSGGSGGLPPAETTSEANAANDTPGVTTAGAADLPPGLLPTTLVPVTGGTFPMGTSPQEIAIAVRECRERDGGADCQESYGQDSIPVHNATVDSFFIEQYEVTNAQYVAFLNSLGPGGHLTGCGGRKCIDTTVENQFAYVTFDSANYTVRDIFQEFPVAGVTWYGAQSYCQAIGRRLPTEAEWERAARGVNNFLYPWGNQWDETRARYRLPTTADAGPVAVGSFENSSEFGAFDMAGNVAEWVQDFYQATYYTQPASTAPNPQGPPSGTTRVKRGGSWDTLPFFLRSVHRQDIAPDSTLLSQGFRCAADQEAVQQNAPAVNPIQPIEETEEAPGSGGAAPTIPPAPTRASSTSANPAVTATQSPQLPPTPPGGS
ncbi:MAG: formylglycine-generating enzyme family protein [bacterium]|nr:formylglycine-generating enzyme family protein [bacterium]